MRVLVHIVWFIFSLLQLSSLKRYGASLFIVAFVLQVLVVPTSHARLLSITVSTIPSGDRERIDIQGEELPESGSKVFFFDIGERLGPDISAFVIFANIISGRAVGNDDPWAAYRYEVTNTSSSPFDLFFSLGFPIERIGGQIFHQSVLDIQVSDTNNDGSGSFTSVFSQNRLSVLDIDFNTGDVVQDTVVLPGAGPIPDVFADDGLVTAVDEPLAVFDLAGELADSGAETVEDSFFTIGGILSAGDSFIIGGFTCFNNSPDDCPDRPEFSVVPIPPAVWLFGSAIVGLVLARRKTS